MNLGVNPRINAKNTLYRKLQASNFTESSTKHASLYSLASSNSFSFSNESAEEQYMQLPMGAGNLGSSSGTLAGSLPAF